MTHELRPDARVLLMGMMGAGKTTVGRALSARTGWPYLDNDALVARAAGEPTDQVLSAGGVPALREVESLALTEALTVPTPVIAAVAGGVVEAPDNLRRLRDGGFVVWLRARLETLAARIGSGEGRPWLGDGEDTQAALRRLYAGRAVLYEQAACTIIDVDDLAPDEVAGRILAARRSATAA